MTVPSWETPYASTSPYSGSRLRSVTAGPPAPRERRLVGKQLELEVGTDRSWRGIGVTRRAAVTAGELADLPAEFAGLVGGQPQRPVVEPPGRRRHVFRAGGEQVDAHLDPAVDLFGHDPQVPVGVLDVLRGARVVGHPQREARRAVRRPPEPVPGVAAFGVLDDEAAVGQHPEVVAGDPAGPPDAGREAGGGGGALLLEQLEQPQPDGVGQALDPLRGQDQVAARVDPGGEAGVRCGAHGPTLHSPRKFCKKLWAIAGESRPRTFGIKKIFLRNVRGLLRTLISCAVPAQPAPRSSSRPR